MEFCQSNFCSNEITFAGIFIRNTGDVRRLPSSGTAHETSAFVAEVGGNWFEA
jgi:hypothetical protein